MKVGLSSELLLVLRVDARSRLPVSTANELVDYLVEESQANSFPALLQGLPTQFLEEARDDVRFTTVVSTDERAARRWNISILWMSFLKCGSDNG